MSKINYGLILLLLFVVYSSCTDITEEYWLEKNGSGKYELTISAWDLIKTLVELDPGGSSQGTTESDLPFSILTTVMLDSNVQYLDTTFSFDEISSENLFSEDGADNFLLHCLVDKTNEISNFSLSFDFKSIAHLIELTDVIPDGNLPEDLAIDSAQFLPAFEYHKRKFSRPAAPFYLSEMIPDDIDLSDTKQRDMLEMFFTGYYLKSIYHLPKKAKIIYGENLSIDHKTMRQEIPLIDLLEDGVHPGFSVKLK